MKVIQRPKARWRISIYDLENKEARTISLEDHDSFKVDDIKQILVDCLNKKAKI